MVRSIRLFWTIFVLAGLLLLAACGNEGSTSSGDEGAAGSSSDCPTPLAVHTGDDSNDISGEGVTGGASDYAGNAGAEEEDEPMGQLDADYVYTDTVGNDTGADTNADEGIGTGATDDGQPYETGTGEGGPAPGGEC